MFPAATQRRGSGRFRILRRGAAFLALLTLLVAAPADLAARASSGSVAGKVVDADGKPLPGATVVLENPALPAQPRGAVTDARGEFRFPAVPPGQEYLLTVSCPSYQKVIFHDVEILPGDSTLPAVTLRPALTETLKVEGKSDVVQSQSATTRTTISSEFLSGLPVMGRDYQDILTLAPGVTDVNHTGNPNIHGARDTDVVTLVDGVNTTDPFTGHYGQELNIESIQEIEVITAGAPAEFSRASGGFVNIVTKSGGNDFKGRFKFYMRTSRLDGVGAGIDPPEVRGGLGEAGGFRHQKFSDLYPFLSVSGPFVKDHLWYYFAPEYSQIEDPINAGTQAYVAATRAVRATAKASWEISSSNHLSLLALFDDTTQDNQGLDSRTAKESGYSFERGGPTVTLQETAVLGTNLSLESTLSRFDQRFAVTPTLNPDTNGNGLLFVDNIPALGGNNDGFINARERDPGEDWDRDGRYDVFEDQNHNGALDGCYSDPDTGDRICFPPQGAVAPWATGGDKNSGCYPDPNDPSKQICPGDKGYDLGPDGVISYCPKDASGNYLYADPTCELPLTLYGEDRDLDGQLTGTHGCEGRQHEDLNCNGRIDAEVDLNMNGKVDCPVGADGKPRFNSPACEDTGIPCSDAFFCPGGYEPGTRGNGKFDTEDVNGNSQLDTVPGAGDTPFPFWNDRNGNGRKDAGEYASPEPPDRDYRLNLNYNRISGPFFYDYSDSRTRNTLKEDLSAYVDDFFGTHDLKMGFLFEDEGFSRTTNQRPFLQISNQSINQNTGRIGGTVGTFLPTQIRVDNTASSDHVGLYLQDTYKPLPNLALGLGIRFDREVVSSAGYEFFNPLAERRVFDALMNLKGVELKAGDLNADGIISVGLTGDPLYDGPDQTDFKALESQLGQIAPSRFTRHNYLTSIVSSQLGSLLDPNLLKNGHPRQPQDFTITNNNLAPRLSLSWDPKADGKSKVFATWGRFYGNLFLETVVGEQGPDTLSPYYTYDADGVDQFGIPDNQIGPLISSAPPSAYQVDRGLRTPFTDELTAGFTREIAPEVTVSVTYVRRDYRDQLQDIDVNHTARKPPYCSPASVTPSGYCDTYGVTLVSHDGKHYERTRDGYPDLYINNFNFNQIFRVGNYNVQAYRGYELQLTRRLKRRWQLDASYVFSKATGQAESFLSESGDDPALTELKSGYLDYDQRHVAKFHAVAYLPGDWQLGGGITWSSGLPYSFVNRFQSEDNVEFIQTRRLFGRRDLNTGAFLGETRNAHRNHAVYDIGVRAQKNFVLGRTAAGAYLEVYNLLNTDDLRISEIDNRSRSFQADETRRFGRRFALGIQFNF